MPMVKAAPLQRGDRFVVATSHRHVALFSHIQDMISELY